MAEDERFDWRASSNPDRSLLYDALKQLVMRGRLDWNSLFRSALGKTPGESYLENFRRGKNSRKDCGLIAEHLAKTFPDEADALYAALRPKARQKTQWERFLEANARAGLLNAVVYEPKVKPEFEEPSVRQSIFLADTPIYLQLDSPIEGYACCLRGYFEYWYHQRLSIEAPRHVIAGRQWLTSFPGHQTKSGRRIPAGPSRIRFEAPYGILNYVVIVSDLDTCRRIEDFKARPRYPLGERAMDALPTILQGSRQEWFIASLILTVVDLSRSRSKGSKTR